jgi:hypothetical protein
MELNKIKSVNIYDDIWTCSDEMRNDISDFFSKNPEYILAEIGSHKGYSTRILSKIFSKVYAIDNSVEWTKFNKEYNNDINNISFINLDIYQNNWKVIPENIDVCFIDAIHTYEHCKSDIINSINRFSYLKYIIFDDYGVWPGVKKIVDEMIENNTLQFEKFIGLNDIPGPNGIISNSHEGIICSINKHYLPLENKSYFWKENKITFLKNRKIDYPLNEGKYNFIKDNIFNVNINNIDYIFIFDSNYSTYTAIKKEDIISGKIISV